MRTFNRLWPFLQLAIPGMLMLMLEYTNAEVMILLAGMIGDTNQLAAQVVLVSILALIIMIPYGFGTAGISMVGNAMGAMKVKKAIGICKMICAFTIIFYLVFGTGLNFAKNPIIGIYTQDEEVAEIVS